MTLRRHQLCTLFVPRTRLPNVIALRDSSPASGRAPSFAINVLRSSPRTTVSLIVSPGSLELTSRTTSSALRTGRPSTATITSPPGGHVQAVEGLLARRLRGGRRWSAGLPSLHLADHRAAAHRVAEVPRERRRQVLGRHAEVGVDDLPVAISWAIERLAALIGIAKPTPSAPPRLAPDLRVDPDHAASCVEERAARVPVRDRRVGLDRVDDLVRRDQRVDRAADRRDDADRDRVLVAERAAHRRDGIARRARATSRRAARSRAACAAGSTRSSATSSYPSQPTIFGLDAVAVPEGDVDLVRLGRVRRLGDVRDHVGARQDVAARRDDEARALGLLRVAVVEEREDRHDAGRARCVDARRVEAVAAERVARRRSARYRRAPSSLAVVGT